MDNKRQIIKIVDETMAGDMQYPVYVRDEQTRKCYLIHYSRFFMPCDRKEKKSEVVTFGLKAGSEGPEMAVESSDAGIGNGILGLMPAVNGIGQYTMHLVAFENDTAYMDGVLVKYAKYRYPLYNGDSFKVGDSTFTVHFNAFYAKARRQFPAGSKPAAGHGILPAGGDKADTD